MSFRTTIANKIIGFGRKLGRSKTSELKVTLSEHSIDVRMVDIDTDGLAWDDNLYKHGNVFIRGYANPIKPRVESDAELANPDTVDVEESDTATEPGSGEGGESKHASVISSNRYKTYMKQSLIADLLNPQEHWNKLMYGILGVIVLQFVTMVLLAFTSGAI